MLFKNNFEGDEYDYQLLYTVNLKVLQFLVKFSNWSQFMNPKNSSLNICHINWSSSTLGARLARALHAYVAGTTESASGQLNRWHGMPETQSQSQALADDVNGGWWTWWWWPFGQLQIHLYLVDTRCYWRSIKRAVRGEQNETLLYRISRQQTNPGGGRESEGRRSLAIGDALVDCFAIVVVAVASS